MRTVEEILSDIEFVRKDIERCRMIGASIICAYDDLLDLKMELIEALEALKLQEGHTG